MSATAPHKGLAKLSYEAAQQELQSLLTRLESQDIALDDLLATYERCQALIAHCHSKLEKIEQQVEQLPAGPSASAATPAPVMPSSAMDDDGIPF